MSEVLVPLNVKLPEDIIAVVGLVSAWVHDPELGSLNRNVFPLNSSDAVLEVMKNRNNQLLGAVLFLAAAGEWTEKHANAAATDLQEVEATNKLKKQIGAVVLLAKFVAAEDAEFNDALYPQTHYSLERSTRLDAVVEALEERRQQHEQAVSEKHMEKEMQTWIAERLKDPDVTGFERLYLLIGANKYDEALLYVDSIVGLNDGGKAWAKREIVVNRCSADPRLDMAEIDNIVGLDYDERAWAKREIVVNRFSADPGLDMAEIDSIVGLDYGQKAGAKREIVVNRCSADPRLDMAEIDSIDGLDDGQKAWAKREIVVNRCSADPRLDMAEIDNIVGLDYDERAWAKREIFNKIMTGLSRKETVREKLNNLKARTSV
ncbi:hypothetical protein KA068_02850 [Candidatus Saccharibacteria bacterium]|nr:hypothetical protein [Candidatus Saccharibacteria bacterium]